MAGSEKRRDTNWLINLLTGLCRGANLKKINLLTSLIMPKPKGGRGYKAPYETHQIRVPDPIASQVHALIDGYQEYLQEGGNPEEPPWLLQKAVHSGELLQKVQDLQEKLSTMEKLKYESIATLQKALVLKANAGGAIKREIEKVLTLLKD